MCRLYGFISSVPRKVECELIKSQNSLLAQSVKDHRGLNNKDGWGLGEYIQGEPIVAKQAGFAKNSEEFRMAVSEAFSNNIISHIRRATIGNISNENTHPFVQDELMLAHNGHVENFDFVKSKILMQLKPKEKEMIKGSTDSEHILALIHNYYYESGVKLHQAFRLALTKIKLWSLIPNSNESSALNIVLSNGHEMVASRFNRSLFYTRRTAVHPCEICDGNPIHIKNGPLDDFRSVVIASEIITSNETWVEVPNESMVWVDENLKVHMIEGKLFEE